MSLQGSNVPLMDLLGITNNVVLERLEFGKHINQMTIILYQFVAKTSTAILVLLLAIASELVSFHAFVIQDIILLAFYLVWSLALFLLGCCWDGLIVVCCPYYRYNLPLLKTRFILI